MTSVVKGTLVMGRFVAAFSSVVRMVCGGCGDVRPGTDGTVGTDETFESTWPRGYQLSNIKTVDSVSESESDVERFVRSSLQFGSPRVYRSMRCAPLCGKNTGRFLIIFDATFQGTLYLEHYFGCLLLLATPEAITRM